MRYHPNLWLPQRRVSFDDWWEGEAPRAQATASEKLSMSASPTAGLRRFLAVLARLVTVALHELVAKLHQDFLLFHPATSTALP